MADQEAKQKAKQEEDNSGQNDLSDLTGVKKAALLLTSLGEDYASEVLKYLSDAEIEKVTMAIAQLKDAPPDYLSQAIEEYHTNMQAKDYIVSGGIDYAREILTDAWGERKAEEVIQRVEATTEVNAFYLLQTVDDKQLLNFLQAEHPQTAAIILAKMKPGQAAEILSSLPENLQEEIAFRLATMGKTSPELIREIEQSIRNQMGTVFGQEMSKMGGSKAVANILNSTTRSAEKNILSGITERNPELAEEIKNLMFVFDDIEQLIDSDVQRITREVDSQTLALSLKGAKPDLKEKIMKNMSERASEMLKDELEYLGPVKVKEVENAQKIVLDTIRDLDEAGDIDISSKTEEEEYIE